MEKKKVHFLDDTIRRQRMMFKRRLLILVLFVLIAVLIYNNILIISELFSKMRLESSQAELDESDHLKEPIFEDNGVWIVNNLIAQYSSKVVIQTSDKIMLEAIVLCEYEDQKQGHIKSKVKFLVKVENQMIFLRVEEVYSIESQIERNKIHRQIWKLRTYLVKPQISFVVKKIYFIVTDFEEYQNMHLTFKNDIETFLVFHRPRIYDARKAKKKAVAHCVHQVRGMADAVVAASMVSWLRLQQHMGIDKVKLYFHEHVADGKRLLAEFESSGFVEIVDYK